MTCTTGRSATRCCGSLPRNSRSCCLKPHRSTAWTEMCSPSSATRIRTTRRNSTTPWLKASAISRNMTARNTSARFPPVTRAILTTPQAMKNCCRPPYALLPAPNGTDATGSLFSTSNSARTRSALWTLRNCCVRASNASLKALSFSISRRLRRPAADWWVPRPWRAGTAKNTARSPLPNLFRSWSTAA